MKLWEYFVCAKKIKIMTWFNNFFSAASVFDSFIRKSTMTHVCVAAHAGAGFLTIEPGCLFTSRGRHTMYIKQSSQTCLKISTERMTCSLIYLNQYIQTMKRDGCSMSEQRHASWYSCEHVLTNILCFQQRKVIRVWNNMKEGGGGGGKWQNSYFMGKLSL